MRPSVTQIVVGWCGRETMSQHITTRWLFRVGDAALPKAGLAIQQSLMLWSGFFGNGACGKRRHRRAQGESGFSLVEMLVVIAIIGMVMGLVGPRVLNYLGEAKVKTAKLQIESFASALDLFYLDVGRYPSADEGLTALAKRPGNASVWNGPYLKNASVPADPWGHVYIYRAPAERGPYEIMSLGSDGQEGGTGTAADIGN
jgi:general secretion pathway protein G